MHEKTGIDFWEYMSFDELLNIVNDYPRFNINDNTLISDIEQLEEGNYIINEFPSANLLKHFPYFMNNSGEILILIINGNIVMNISKRGCSYYSGELLPILKDGNNILLDVHSHPYEDKNVNVGVPSINDLKNCNSFNKLAYIIHDKGVLEFDLSSIENIDKDILDMEFWKFIYNNENYMKLNIYEQENIFYDSIGLKRRQITIDEFYKISNDLIKEKSINKRR